MSNLWFADMVQAVLGSISVAAGGSNRQVQINVGGLLAGFPTWLGQSNGTMEGTARTDADASLTLKPFSATQTAAIFRITDAAGTLPTQQGSSVISGPGVANADLGLKVLDVMEVDDGDTQFLAYWRAKNAAAASGFYIGQASSVAGFGNANSVFMGNWNGLTGIVMGKTIGAVVDCFQFTGAGIQVGETTGRKLAFLGATPISKPTVAGAKLALDVVMASLLTALSNYGLIIDTTT